MTLALFCPLKVTTEYLLPADRLRAHRGVVRRRGLEEAVRRHPDLELLRPRRVGADDDGLGLRLLASDRLLASAARRLLALQPDAVHTRGRHLEVDHALVGRVDEPRPRRARVVGLTEGEVVSVAGVLDGAQLSAPMAFEAAAITPLASCADGMAMQSRYRETTIVSTSLHQHCSDRGIS